MTAKRHADALDRLDAQATSALDLFFGGPPTEPESEPESEPSTELEPVEESESAPEPETDTPAAGGPGRGRARRKGSKTPPNAPQIAVEPPPPAGEGPGPAEGAGAHGSVSGANARPVYVPVATGISALADDRLHRAAYAAGGEREKSRLVREAVGELIGSFDADPVGREGLRELMRRPPTEGRITRIYRLEPEVRERLTLFARDERIPIAAVLRAAIERRYGSEALPSDEPAG